MAKTRFNNAAQSRRSLDRVGLGLCVGVGDEADCGVVCSVVGVVVVGRGPTCARRRLVGAKTPCQTLIHNLAVMKGGNEAGEVGLRWRDQVRLRTSASSRGGR